MKPLEELTAAVLWILFFLGAPIVLLSLERA